MRVVTVNISFPKQLLKTMDALAKRESRSRSDILRSAARVYVERHKRWEQIFAFGREQAKRLRLKPEDVSRLIAESRREQSKPR